MTIENSPVREEDFSILKDLLREAATEQDPEKIQKAKEIVNFIHGIIKTFWPHKFIGQEETEVNSASNP